MVKDVLNRGALAAANRVGLFWGWWRSRLFEGLPPGARRWFVEVQEECVVRLEESGAVLERRRLDAVTARKALASPAGIAEALGTLSGDRRVRRVIQVSPEQVLSRTLEWPLQAESNLRNAIGYQLENLVPLPADSVYFDYVVRRRRPEAGLVEFELVTVPRDIVDPWLDALEASSGTGVDAITVAGRDARLNLLPERRRATATNRSGLWLGLLGGAAVALLVAALVLPLYGKARELALIEDRVAKLTGKAEAVRLLRQEFAADVAAVQQVVAERRRLPSRVALLDILAEHLPDDTHLVALELKGDQLAIRGEAPSTIGLVEKLSAVEAFDQVDFGASVTRNSRTGKERFRLDITVKEPDLADGA
jgi:general secretion pathway protein L